MFFNRADKDNFSLPRKPSQTYQHASPSAAPRFAISWGNRGRNFTENLLALLRGPAPPKKFSGSGYFRHCWVSGPLPDRAFAASALWHVAFVLLLVRLSPFLPSRPKVVLPRVEITWYGPIDDLPPIVLAPRKPEAPAEATKKPLPPPSVDAFHPRQIILNNPMLPNHPRQTLIQPTTPPEPPKILPPLPNIVVWNEITQPKLRIDPAALAPLQPKAPVVRQEQVAPPELANHETLVGAVNIAELDAGAKPSLPISPMSLPNPVSRQARNQPSPEPDLAAGARSDMRLIALSAMPGLEMPPAVPPGNLSSRVAIAPESTLPGVPDNSPTETLIESTKGDGGGSPLRTVDAGPPDLSISRGDTVNSNISGLDPSIARFPALPGTPAAAPPAVPVASTRPSALLARIKSSRRPEALLGPRPIYTLNINMPNMTSATGSWILRFAELGSRDPETNADPANLSGPELLRKIDPKYPPELRSRRVQGEVVLYAIIRKDGTVDSIELVEGVDPVLDENTLQALAQWRFRPAERQGTRIELGAIVYIPFQAVLPLY